MDKNKMGLLWLGLVMRLLVYGPAGVPNDEQLPKIGPVKDNGHSANIEGETVVH